MDKKMKIPKESIYKLDSENFSKLFIELRVYISKLEYVIEKQRSLITTLENMLMTNCRIPFDPRWFNSDSGEKMEGE